MKIVLIDGQGGRMGQQLAARIKAELPDVRIYAIGTNSAATEAMLKGGADTGATGENPVIVACRDADIIIGPIGIISADSMLGEITPAMAVAIGQSKALKLLLPVGHCNNEIIGAENLSMGTLIKSAAERIRDIISRPEEA